MGLKTLSKARWQNAVNELRRKYGVYNKNCGAILAIRTEAEAARKAMVGARSDDVEGHKAKVEAWKQAETKRRDTEREYEKARNEYESALSRSSASVRQAAGVEG